MPDEAFEEAIRDAEGLLALRITVHDLAGALRDAEGRPLLPAIRASHQGHPACATGWDARCVAHCRRQVNATVAANRPCSAAGRVCTRSRCRCIAAGCTC